jgi:CMP-N-acetylneuraminic acid synthetase
MRESSYKCFIIENGFFKGLFPQEKRPDYTNLPRQLFPKTYQPDGYVDVIKRKTVIKEGVLYGSKILAFITPNTGELDTLEDLEFIKFKLERGNYKIYKYLKNNFRR